MDSTPKGEPILIYGTGFLGTESTFPTSEETSALLDFLQKKGIQRLDTARRYPALHPGRAETLLGEAGAALRGFTIDTKVKVDPAIGIVGSLTESKIAESIEESYAALRLRPGHKLNILYPHAPDPETPIAESARAFDKAFRQGKFGKLGLSNYTTVQVEEWMRVAEEEGLVKPSVFQGQYNPLWRSMEDNGLLMTLRKYGISLNVYSPLAGGFLTGRATAGQAAGTRFEGRDAMEKAAKGQFDRDYYHEALRRLKAVADTYGLTLVEISMRWLMHHSILSGGDGIIIGGSRLEQIEKNTIDVEKGELPEEVVAAVEAMWTSVKENAS